MTEINNKMMQKALNKLNPQESVKVLMEINKSVEAVWENQKQMAPAMISIWDRIEYLDRKLNYNNQLVQKILREQKLPYDEFTEQEPKTHIDMVME